MNGLLLASEKFILRIENTTENPSVTIRFLFSGKASVLWLAKSDRSLGSTSLKSRFKTHEYTNPVLVLLLVLLALPGDLAAGLVHHLQQQLVVDLVDRYATCSGGPVAELAQRRGATFRRVLTSLGQRADDVELGATMGPASGQRAGVAPPLVLVVLMVMVTAAAAGVGAAALAGRLGVTASLEVRALQTVPGDWSTWCWVVIAFVYLACWALLRGKVWENCCELALVNYWSFELGRAMIMLKVVKAVLFQDRLIK